MENFFDWVSKSIPKEEVLIWFNVHNMNFEKIDLYGDFVKSLIKTILDTYLGDDTRETTIYLSVDEKLAHFNWCWNKVVDNFSKENINIKKIGAHKDYFESFFFDTFYEPKEDKSKYPVNVFVQEIFDMDKSFTKSDLDILTELYLLMDKNLE